MATELNIQSKIYQGFFLSFSWFSDYFLYKRNSSKDQQVDMTAISYQSINEHAGALITICQSIYISHFLQQIHHSNGYIWNSNTYKHFWCIKVD